MNKYAVLAVFLLILTMSLSSSNVVDDPTKIANEQIWDFLNKIPITELANFGILSKDDLHDIYLDGPYNLLSINSDLNYDNNIKSIDLQDFTRKTDMWFFPLKLKEENIAILIVDKLQDKWKVVSFGYASLARELEKIESLWSNQKNYQIKLLTSFNLQKYFFSITENNQTDNLTEIYLSVNESAEKSKYLELEKIGYSLKQIKMMLTSLEKR